MNKFHHNLVENILLFNFIYIFCFKSFKLFIDIEITKYNNIDNNNKKYFNCDLCVKKYLNFYRLKTHYRIHTGERPYKCEICNKAFTRSDIRNKHLKIHQK